MRRVTCVMGIFSNTCLSMFIIFYITDLNSSYIEPEL